MDCGGGWGERDNRRSRSIYVGYLIKQENFVKHPLIQLTKPAG